jgi:hypothetical protein
MIKALINAGRPDTYVMGMRVLRGPIVFLRFRSVTCVHFSILILSIKTVHCSIRSLEISFVVAFVCFSICSLQHLFVVAYPLYSIFAL